MKLSTQGLVYSRQMQNHNFISLHLSRFHTDLVFSQVDFQYGKKRAPKNTAF